MIAFATPLALLLFIPWGFAAWRLLRRARRQASPFPGLALVPRVVTWRQRLGVLPPYLMLAGLAAVIITFLLASGMFLAVRLLARDRIIGFGLASVLAFLATVVAAVLGRKP